MGAPGSHFLGSQNFEPNDIAGAFLVIAATSLREVNEAVFQETKRRESSATP